MTELWQILKSTQTPTFDGLIRLAVIVIMRVMLGYILERNVEK